MSASNVTPLHAADHARPSPGPASIEAEQAVLGGILVFPDMLALVGDQLRPEHLTEEIHRRIYAVARDLAAAGTAISPMSVLPFLGDHDLGGGVSTREYLARLCADTSAPSTIPPTAQFLRDLALRRGLIEIGRDIADRGLSMPAGSAPDKMVAEAIEQLYSLSTTARTVTRREAGASAADLVERIRQIRAGEAKDEGASTGFRRLDELTSGYQPGTLWILGARPGVGKTVYAVTSANKVARRDIGVLVFSLEVPEQQITARLLADLGYTSRRPITFQQIMTGQLDDAEMWIVEDAQRRLARSPLVVDSASRLTVAEIRARIHMERDRIGKRGVALKVAFIDYLKFVQASDRYSGQRVYEVGEISAGLKQIAKDEHICIVLLAQLNRALEQRDDKRPSLPDLRESGDLEADADVVVFLHREAYFVEKSAAYRKHELEATEKFVACKNQAELIIGKNRAGPTQTVELWCDVASSTMSSHAREEAA